MFTDLNDDQLSNVRDALERELTDRARIAEERRPKPRIEDIKAGMSPEQKASVYAEIGRVLRGA